MDRYDLYELCVQSPADLVPLLRAVHGGRPLVLGEDFCGTGALSVEWTRRVEGGRAIAVDLDPEPLARLERARRTMDGAPIEIVRGDVARDTASDRHRADIVYAGNFSIGEWHERAALLAYLRHARSRLNDGGILACDLYGGETAFLTGDVRREHPGPDGRLVLYTWQQREADPLTGMVENALHFEVRRGGAVEMELRDAFVYRWRLWGIPELRDAMREAGFARTDVYPKVPDAVDDDGVAYAMPIEDPADLGDSFEVLVVGRA